MKVMSRFGSSASSSNFSPANSQASSLASEDTMNIDTNAPVDGVGLSDPVQSESRRRLLDLVNRLHSTGVQLDIDLPMIAVVGSQSAGKSSLIESISGITLPRASGTCTRCPTECRLSYSERPWKCTVSLRFTIGHDGQPLGTPRTVVFGDIITEKFEVEERLRRAQRAILNPSTLVETFLKGVDEDLDHHELSFSMNCVSLQISGKDLTDLSFCDLPGLIASVSNGGNTNDIELVKNLITTYISKPSCLILLTVACETDFENQGAHHLAKQHDPEGKRTIGVLTKPDRISTGEEDRWMRLIRNDAEPLDNGWFSVKQPNSQALAKGISWAEAREQEKLFFSNPSYPWSFMEESYRRQLGTQNLTERLSVILSDLIRRRLPELQEELQALVKATRKSLNLLPDPPSKDPVSEVIHLVATFTRELARLIEGTPDPKGIVQSIHPLQQEFRRSIRKSAPNFRPYPRADDETTEFRRPAFLENEEGPADLDAAKTIFIDEVMDRATQAKTRELPDNYPFAVTKMFITDVIDGWDEPSYDLLDKCLKIVTISVNKVVAEHFGKYPGLYQRVTVIVNEVVAKCYERTLQYIKWNLRCEMGVFTLNEHYFQDYKAKFLTHYRGSRQKGLKKSLIETLEEHCNSEAQLVDGVDQRPVTRVLAGLSELGVQAGVMDLPKMMETDPYAPALEIMASVRAYFQVAYKRFVDNVPMTIDQELLRGLDLGREIEGALLDGLGVGGPTGHQRCSELLQEPSNVMIRREDLSKKLKRLETAKSQLMELF